MSERPIVLATDGSPSAAEATREAVVRPLACCSARRRVG